MTKTQSLLFRTLLFIAGIGLIVLAFFLFKGDRGLDRTDLFFWISIGVMYFVFFIPFFFSAINIENFSGKIPALSMVWFGIILYIALSIVLLVLLKKQLLPLRTVIIFQAGLFFIILLNIYLAYFAVSHVGDVAAEEAGMKQYITQIKSKAQSLQLYVNNLSSEYEKPQKILTQTLDDIKYISPLGGGAGGASGRGGDLEQTILNLLEKLTEILRGIQDGAHSVSLEGEAFNLQAAVRERKLLRN